MDYKTQINHPKWQRKRTEIMQRDNFICRCCGEKEIQLHVHHLYYLPSTLIWDYDSEALVTVCKICHEIISKELPKISGIIAFDILRSKLDFFKTNYDGRK